MLRFNSHICFLITPNLTISIHPMLRFNWKGDGFLKDRISFQYILCYGSTVVKLKNPDVKDIFQYILCYGSTLWCANKSLASLCISIHPMLRFNYVLNGIDWKQRKFQYILCYGSTPTIKLPKIKKHNFNTSYVTVQPLSLN